MQDSASSIELPKGRVKLAGLTSHRSIKTLLRAPAKLRRAAWTCTGGHNQEAAEVVQAGTTSHLPRPLAPVARKQAHSSPEPFLRPEASRKRLRHTLAVPGSLRDSATYPKLPHAVLPSKGNRATRGFPCAAKAACQLAPLARATRKEAARPSLAPSKPASSCANPFLFAACQSFAEPARVKMTADTMHSNAASSNTIPSAFRMSTSTSGTVSVWQLASTCTPCPGTANRLSHDCLHGKQA